MARSAKPVKSSKVDLSYDLVRAEMALENIGFFTPSKIKLEHHIKVKTFEYRYEDDCLTTTVKIKPDIELGLPITVDLDYYRAFQKILELCLQGGEDISQPIRVPAIRLMKLAGKTPSNTQSQRIRDWLERMSATFISGKIYRPTTGEYIELKGSVFSQFCVRGDRLPGGVIADTNYVWLAPFYQDNIRQGYLRPIDLNFHNQLTRPIAKSLYPLLDTGWHAAGHNTYQKSYRSLCGEFLLTCHPKLSRAKQQLDPVLAELADTGYLRSWSYRVAKTKTPDWVISFAPGKRFFEYQELKNQKLTQHRAIATSKQIVNETATRSLVFTPHQNDLFEQVLDFCGERNDTIAVAGFKRAVGNYAPETVQAALTEAKLAQNEGNIKKTRGAFFHDMLKRLDTNRN